MISLENQETREQGRAGKEAYILQDTNSEKLFAKRTANVQAAFLLPHLRPGMNLLDCGCGPGSITLDLAQFLDPGNVVAIDIQASQIEAASHLAAEKGVTNVRFEIANVFELPFADASFDAVHANALLMHMRDLQGALKEMWRVLKPGGVIGVRDLDSEFRVWVPYTPGLQEYTNLVRKTAELMGLDMDFPPYQRRLLREAGFVRPEAYADVESFATPERTAVQAEFLVNALQGPFGKVALEQGFATKADIEGWIAEFRDWAKEPDALFSWVWYSAVGWKPE